MKPSAIPRENNTCGQCGKPIAPKRKFCSSGCAFRHFAQEQKAKPKKNWTYKVVLTNALADQIRQEYRTPPRPTQKMLAKKYKLSPLTIMYLVKNDNWKFPT